MTDIKNLVQNSMFGEEITATARLAEISLALVGRTTFINQLDCDMSFGAFMGVIRSRITKNILPKYLFYFLNSKNAKKFFIDNAHTTTNISNLNFTILSDLQIPLPPIETQHKIVEEFDNTQLAIDNLEKIIENLKKQIDLDSISFTKHFNNSEKEDV